MTFEQIDYVFCTHLHIDHTGWNTTLRDGRWVPAFPNAKYIFHKREYAAWEADPFTFAPAGGESGVAVLARALPVIRQIVTAHSGAQVLVVSHKATLRLIVSSLLAFDPRGFRDRLDQSPACLNVVDFRDPVRARLMLFNDTSHYSDRPRLPEQSLSKWWDRTVST